MEHASRRRFLAGSASLAAVAAAPLRVRAQSAPRLRVGVTPTDVFAEAYYAAELGLFRKAGLDVDVQTFSSGAAAANAIVGGSLDIGVTTPLLLANGALRGVPFVIIAAGPVNTPKAPQSLLCVAKNGPIRGPKDLVGKTVGLNVLRTVLELSLDAWLDKNGVKPSSVRRVEIVFSAMGPAVERGDIAAADIAEPALTVALKKSNVRALGDPNADIAPRYLAGAWFTTRPFAERNVDAVKRFAEVIYEAGRWANGHHAESAQILAKYTKVDPELARSMIRADYAEQMDVAEMQTLLDVSVKYGFLAKPVKATDLILA
jgi:NitT/TauT family transport system substrate-binding protein